MKTAWVTLLSTPTYLPGVRTLWKSLRLAGSAQPLVVMVTPNIDTATRSVLTADGCEVLEVEPISPSPQQHTRYAADRVSEGWTKLRVLELTSYDRVVFLDADMLVLRNIDELFTIPLRAGSVFAGCPACVCNPNNMSTYPAHWIPSNCAYNKPGSPADYFNSGLLVLKPDLELAAHIAEFLANAPDLTRYTFADQDLLNELFAGRWHELPYFYNALKTLPQVHSDIWNIEDVRIVHYIQEKPWEVEFEKLRHNHPYADLYTRWWETHLA